MAKENNGSITFNPSVTCRTNLAKCFCIFANEGGISITPAERQPPPRGITLNDESLTVYTDRSCLDNGKASIKCSTGVWFAENHRKNMSVKIGGDHLTNQIGELAAVIIALKKTPTYVPLTVKTNLKYIINGLTTYLETWEDRGWIGIMNKEWFKKAAYLLRHRSAPTFFQWVKGHNSEKGNKESYRLAKQGAGKQTTDKIDLAIPQCFDMQGAHLLAITQSLTYKGIGEHRNKHTVGDQPHSET
jgi:ribonuclease HI